MKAKNLFLSIAAALLTFTIVAAQDVYVAGTIEAKSAVVWKNGVPATLTMPQQADLIYISSLFVNKGDVYVLGYYYKTGSNSRRYIYWKNNALTEVQAGEYPRDMYVSGNDFYLAGSRDAGKKYDVATVWKNGAPTDLTDGNADAYASSIHISGNDVYILGGVRFEQPRRIIRMWKNGAPTDITDGVNDADLAPQGIYVEGSDVYVSGYDSGYGNARYWKNGAATKLSDVTWDHDIITSIRAKNGNAYVAGYYQDVVSGKYVSKLWTNGVAEVNTGDVKYESLAVAGNDIYISGWRRGIGATLWKNGAPQSLSQNASSSADAVFITGSGADGAEDIIPADKSVYYDMSSDEAIVSGLNIGESLSIYTPAGRPAVSLKATHETERIRVQGLPQGVYFIKTGSGATLKWIKR
ncbi:MAG: T9SS type A sorting domain-containing protein [Tannerellaceae bacterium]|nr:T9SS type A sorting domain-containing protein [Tannerellaceae bacterium]